MSDIVKRLEDRARGDGLGTYATKPYTVFDSNLDRAAAAEITRLEAEVSRLTNLAQEGRKAALEEVEKLADEKTTAAIKAMEEPGKAKLGDGEDAFLKYFVATKVALVNLDILIAIRALIPQEPGEKGK